jgi:hypothetical protein
MEARLLIAVRCHPIGYAECTVLLRVGLQVEQILDREMICQLVFLYSSPRLRYGFLFQILADCFRPAAIKLLRTKKQYMSVTTFICNEQQGTSIFLDFSYTVYMLYPAKRILNQSQKVVNSAKCTF